MISPASDQSSDGGIAPTSNTAPFFRSSHGPAHSIYSRPPLSHGSIAPSATASSSLSMAASFNDVRAACQSAQSRIMRLQQATNNQVGLTSTIREGWFEELRNVAQCFITAQQASAKLEQTVNTERAQLQGALSAALNERDLRTSERDSAEQEVKFLRGRLNELLGQVKRSAGSANINHTKAEPTTSSDSWVMASLSENSPEMAAHQGDTSDDIFKQLPTTIEDMPFSPKKPNGGPPRNNTSFSSSDLDNTDGPGHIYQPRTNTPRFANRGYRNGQSKFFSKNGGALLQGGQGTHAGGSGHSTPDFANRSGSARFSRTPGVGSHGPFVPPPLPQRMGGIGTGHRRTPSSVPPTGGIHEPAPSGRPPSSTHKNQGYAQARESTEKSQKNVQTMPPMAPRAMLEPAPRTETPAPGKELALFQEEQAGPTEFAPGVQAPRGSPDEERVQGIFYFFNAIKDWVDRYCSIPNVDAMHNMSHQYPRLWDYACSVTYPNNRHNAASHSLFMLCNKSCRTFFISRLVIQYVVQHMWSPQAWEGLDEKLTDVLVTVKHRLDPTYGYDAVLQPHERHGLIEKRSRAIYDFMRQPNWTKCKAHKVNQAANRFKDIVGPMMNMDKVDHQSALHELIGICEGALRLSAVLNTSRLSFQFIFNECGIKFSEQSHRPLNSTIPARELQAHHWRLMCVVTPGVTYRNDAGVSVDPRFLAKANVLLMQ